MTDPSYYIIHINGYAILRQCKAGYTYSPSYCDCIKPKLTRIPRVAVFVITKRILGKVKRKYFLGLSRKICLQIQAKITICRSGRLSALSSYHTEFILRLGIKH